MGVNGPVGEDGPSCFWPFQNTELSLPVPSNVSAMCCQARLMTEVIKTTGPPFGLAVKRVACVPPSKSVGRTVVVVEFRAVYAASVASLRDQDKQPRL